MIQVDTFSSIKQSETPPNQKHKITTYIHKVDYKMFIINIHIHYTVIHEPTTMNKQYNHAMASDKQATQFLTSCKALLLL